VTAGPVHGLPDVPTGGIGWPPATVDRGRNAGPAGGRPVPRAERGATDMFARIEPPDGMSKKAILVVALLAVALVYVVRR